MTSPPLTDQKIPPGDPVDALRVLVADLRGLALRLDLKENGPARLTTQKAQERVCGPRAVVVLLGEDEEVKRRFLQRLLGPNLAPLSKSTTECTRLEYGTEARCVMTAPQGSPAAQPLVDTTSGATEDTPRSAMQTIQLPNPTLKGGLAVIDTPAIEQGEPSASVLECIEQADAWIFVLNADHALSHAGQALLRRLPERGTRLEIVVENAEALSGEERLAARDRLMQTLREQCHMETPRLTLVASAATEGDESSFWHGRFATFHSVMMLRGREHWMESTRALVLAAMAEVGAEIDLELKNLELGLRHARLRLGMKDLDGLRTRFNELGPAGAERPAGTKRVDLPPVETIPNQSRLNDIWSGGSDDTTTRSQPTAGLSPLAMLAEAMATIGPENPAPATTAAKAAVAAIPDVTEKDLPAKTAQGALVFDSLEAGDALETGAKRPDAPSGHTQGALNQILAAEIPAAAAVTTPSKSGSAFPTHPAPMSGAAAKARPKRGVSVHLDGNLKRLMPQTATHTSSTLTLLKRVAWVALVLAFICLILWALAPRGFLFGHEPPAEWDFQQPKPALASRAVPAASSDDNDALPQPGDPSALPSTAGAATPNIASTPLVKPRRVVRLPLAHPIPSDAIAGTPPRAKRHHHHFLGLGKLWHWMRHPHHSRRVQNDQ